MRDVCICFFFCCCWFGLFGLIVYSRYSFSAVLNNPTFNNSKKHKKPHLLAYLLYTFDHYPAIYLGKINTYSRHMCMVAYVNSCFVEWMCGIRHGKTIDTGKKCHTRLNINTKIDFRKRKNQQTFLGCLAFTECCM